MGGEGEREGKERGGVHGFIREGRRRGGRRERKGSISGCGEIVARVVGALFG